MTASLQCPVCGFSYVPTLAQDRKAHRRWHAEHLRPRQPKPDQRLKAEDMRVDRRSPRWLHRLVYERARALQRGQGYDFAQWSEDGGDPEDTATRRDYHAWLLIELAADGPIAIGAAAFNWILWRNMPPCWRLDFVWIAEGWRRRGALSRRWPIWRAAYGDFVLESPLSDAMRSFVDKQGGPPHPVQREAWKGGAGR